MTNDEVKALILAELHKIAPEVDLNELDPTIDLREQVDIDSMDVLNLAIAIHESTGIDIPEADYPKILTLEGCVAYLRAHGIN